MEAYDRSSVAPRELDPRIRRVADLFHEDLTSAAFLAAQFDLDLKPPLTFYLSRNRIAEISFFVWFFSQPEVRRVFPDLGPLNTSPDDPPDSYAAQRIGAHLGLRHTDTWTTMATLAHWIRRYGTFLFADPPTDRETMRLVLGVARAAFRGQPSEALAHSGWERWCGWFWGIENTTLFWIDRRTGLVTVIMITDGP
jgi:hypothetical protein